MDLTIGIAVLAFAAGGLLSGLLSRRALRDLRDSVGELYDEQTQQEERLRAVGGAEMDLRLRLNTLEADHCAGAAHAELAARVAELERARGRQAAERDERREEQDAKLAAARAKIADMQRHAPGGLVPAGQEF